MRYLYAILRCVCLAALLICVFALDVQEVKAGPILNRIRENRAARQQQYAPAPSACVCGDECQCASGTCPSKCPVQKPAAAPQTYYRPAASGSCPSCQSGSCPAPTQRRTIFR